MEKVNFLSKWILRISIIFSLVYTIITNHWVGTAGGTIILAATFIVDYINYKFYKINKCITSMVYAYCLFSLVLGNMWDFYDSIEWWDIIMHIFSGIILGKMGDIIINGKHANCQMNSAIKFLFIVGISCIGGVFWEIYEFFIDSGLGLDTQLSEVSGVVDTMWDLVADVAGGVGTAIFICYHKIKNE